MRSRVNHDLTGIHRGKRVSSRKGNVFEFDGGGKRENFVGRKEPHGREIDNTVKAATGGFQSHDGRLGSWWCKKVGEHLGDLQERRIDQKSGKLGFRTAGERGGA